MGSQPLGAVKALVLLALLAPPVVACRTATGVSEAKDIATNSTSNGTLSGVYLYFREGQSISRTRCADGILAVNYDRAHCTDDKQSVPAKLFVDALSTGVGTTITAHTQNVQDLYAGIVTVDNELLQLIAAVPAVLAQVQALRQQLATAETGIAAIQVQINGVDQQIAALQSQLATQDSVDLDVQLGHLLDQRATLVKGMNQSKADEQAKRTAFIAANSSTLDQETFNDVQAQKTADVQQLTTEQAALSSAMQEVSDLNKTIAYISDSTFTYDVIGGQAAFQNLTPFTLRFQAVFDGLLTTTSIAPDFAPVTFVVGAVPAVTLASQPPSWAVSVYVSIDDVTSTLPANSQVTLPLSTSVEGTHAIVLQLGDANGNRSQPSPEGSIAVTPTPPPPPPPPPPQAGIYVFAAGDCAAGQCLLAVQSYPSALVRNAQGQSQLASFVSSTQIHVGAWNLDGAVTYGTGGILSIQWSNDTQWANAAGLVATAGGAHGNVPKWADVTPGGGCAANASGCMYNDLASGLTVTALQPAQPGGLAANFCETLDFGGFSSGWHLPTTDQLQALSQDGIASQASSSFISSNGINNYWFWSASPANSSAGPHQMVAVILAGNIQQAMSAFSDNSVICVR